MTSSDIDGASAVYDLDRLRLLDTIPLPPIVRQLGGKPHDLTISGFFVFITYLGTSDGNGYVASYLRSGDKYLFFRMLQTKADPHVRPDLSINDICCLLVYCIFIETMWLYQRLSGGPVPQHSSYQRVKG